MSGDIIAKYFNWFSYTFSKRTMLIRKCLNLIIFSSEEFLGKVHQNNTYSNAVKLPTLVYQVSVIFKTFIRLMAEAISTRIQVTEDISY